MPRRRRGTRCRLYRFSRGRTCRARSSGDSGGIRVSPRIRGRRHLLHAVGHHAGRRRQHRDHARHRESGHSGRRHAGGSVHANTAHRGSVRLRGRRRWSGAAARIMAVLVPHPRRCWCRRDAEYKKNLSRGILYEWTVHSTNGPDSIVAIVQGLLTWRRCWGSSPSASSRSRPSARCASLEPYIEHDAKQGVEYQDSGQGA